MVLIWPKLLPNDRPGGMSALAGSRLSPAEALGLCQSRLGTGSAGHTGAGKRGKVGKGGLAGRVGGPRLFSVTLQLGGLFGSKGGGSVTLLVWGTVNRKNFGVPFRARVPKGWEKTPGQRRSWEMFWKRCSC